MTRANVPRVIPLVFLIFALGVVCFLTPGNGMAIEQEKESCIDLGQMYSRGILTTGMPAETQVLNDCLDYFRNDLDAAANAIFGLLVRGHYQLGETLLSESRLSGLRASVARDYLRWAETLDSGADVTEVVERLRGVADKAESDFLIKNVVANVLATSGDFQPAIELLESVDAAHPNEPFHLRLMTIVYFRTGDIGLAADAGYRALETVPHLDGDAPFMTSLSWSMAAGGQHETAKVIFERLLTQNPNASNRPIVIRYQQWLEGS